MHTAIMGCSYVCNSSNSGQTQQCKSSQLTCCQMKDCCACFISVLARNSMSNLNHLTKKNPYIIQFISWCSNVCNSSNSGQTQQYKSSKKPSANHCQKKDYCAWSISVLARSKMSNLNHLTIKTHYINQFISWCVAGICGWVGIWSPYRPIQIWLPHTNLRTG